MKDFQNLFRYTIKLLSQKGIKHKYTNFPSGATMLDIWYNNKFYVMQFDDDHIGFSEINDDNPGFDTCPDEKFSDEFLYKKKLDRILNEIIEDTEF